MTRTLLQRVTLFRQALEIRGFPTGRSTYDLADYLGDAVDIRYIPASRGSCRLRDDDVGEIIIPRHYDEQRRNEALLEELWHYCTMTVGIAVPYWLEGHAAQALARIAEWREEAICRTVRLLWRFPAELLHLTDAEIAGETGRSIAEVQKRREIIIPDKPIAEAAHWAAGRRYRVGRQPRVRAGWDSLWVSTGYPTDHSWCYEAPAREIPLIAAALAMDLQTLSEAEFGAKHRSHWVPGMEWIEVAPRGARKTTVAVAF